MITRPTKLTHFGLGFSPATNRGCCTKDSQSSALLLQFLEKAFHVQNVLGLGLSKGGENGGGFLRVMSVTVQFYYQRFLFADMSLALGHVTFCLGQVL